MNSKLLKELCIKNKCGVYGIPASAEDFDASKTRYLRITDIAEDGKLINENKKSVSSKDLEKYILNEGDLVFARTGNSTGKTYYHEAKNGRLAFAGFLIKYSLDPNLVNPKYLRYYTITRHYKEWVENFSLGSTRGNINAQSFGECPIPLPSRLQQDYLVKVLSDLDSKIELNNKINSELEAIVKTLYDYWFVQFDFPDANGKPYKTSGGKMVWNAELKREIPEGWEVTTISKVIEVKDGTHDSPKSKPTGYPLITSKNLKVEGLDFENANLISKEDYLSVNKRSQVETGDILFSMIGNIGTIYKVEEKEIKFAIKNVALYKTSQKGEYKNFIYMFLKSIDMDRYMKNVISGSIQKFIGLSSLRNTPFLINETCIKRYEIQTKSIFTQLENLKLENKELASLRDWLLPMLMNGQVSVGGYEVEERELRMVAEGNVEYKK